MGQINSGVCAGSLQAPCMLILRRRTKGESS